MSAGDNMRARIRIVQAHVFTPIGYRGTPSCSCASACVYVLTTCSVCLLCYSWRVTHIKCAHIICSVPFHSNSAESILVVLFGMNRSHSTAVRVQLYFGAACVCAACLPVVVAAVVDVVVDAAAQEIRERARHDFRCNQTEKCICFVCASTRRHC